MVGKREEERGVGNNMFGNRLCLVVDVDCGLYSLEQYELPHIYP